MTLKFIILGQNFGMRNGTVNKPVHLLRFAHKHSFTPPSCFAFYRWAVMTQTLRNSRMYMPCASLKMADSVDSVKQNTLFRYFNTFEKTKGDDRKWKETGSESKKTQTEYSGPQNARLRKFQPQWNAGWLWLQYSENTNSMTCSIHYIAGGQEEGSQSALASKEGCTTFRLETLGKHGESAAHKLAVKEKNLTLDKTQMIVVIHFIQLYNWILHFNFIKLWHASFYCLTTRFHLQHLDLKRCLSNGQPTSKVNFGPWCIATVWPNVRNMLRSVALQCCKSLAGG